MNDHLYFAASLHRLYNLTLRDFGRANGLSQRQGQFFRALQRGLTPEQQAQADAYFAVLQRNINAELARLGEGGPVTGRAGT